VTRIFGREREKVTEMKLCSSRGRWDERYVYRAGGIWHLFKVL